ncbi:outer membrane protein assembly factor BamD [Priestia endophytica]|uniref:Uncharacterized protein n=1 Tax=Priestia endophytica DSM 13796 TaxID=1121089 RepID=A0A1I6C0T8_9BACI|nr:hypothetical protein [Priestia endophytica]KYG33412.1 hypothetical protein AZF06_21440 [Priestia endophytica]SFQ86767.1 hypothetical protein SAMN02745910_04717 [Priestia endophytica DSM 13796]
MKKLNFNDGTLGFSGNIVTYEVPITSTNINSIDELQDLHHAPFLFSINEMNFSENRSHFFMSVEVEKNYVPFSFFKMKAEDNIKYLFIEQLCAMAEELSEYPNFVTVLDDKNILINIYTGEIKLVYMGIKNLMPSLGYEEDLLTQIKRLSLLMVTPTSFDELKYNGIETASQKSSAQKYGVVSRILAAEAFDDIRATIEAEKETEEIKEEEETKKSIFQRMPSLKKNQEKEVKKPVDESANKALQNKRKIEKAKNAQKPKEKVNKVDKEAIKSRNRARALESDSEESQPKFKVSFGNSKLKIAAVSFVGVMVLLWAVASFSNNDSPSKAKDTVANAQEENDYLTKGLQYASIQDYENAVKEFEHMDTPFKELSKSNQKSILFSYLMTDNFQKAIDAEPRFASSIVNFLVAKDRLDEVKNLNTKNPIIKFEKSYLNNDFKNVLKYKDDVELDGRRESMVVEAYIGLEKFDEGYDFAKSKGNKDLMIKVRQKQIEKLKKGDASSDEVKSKIDSYTNEINQLSQ